MQEELSQNTNPTQSPTSSTWIDCEELEANITVAEIAANAVGMELGAEKCGVAHLRKGKVVSLGGSGNQDDKDKRGGGGPVQQVGWYREMGGLYANYVLPHRYLGVQQLIGPKTHKVKQMVKKEYL